MQLIPLDTLPDDRIRHAMLTLRIVRNGAPVQSWHWSHMDALNDLFWAGFINADFDGEGGITVYNLDRGQRMWRAD